MNKKYIINFDVIPHEFVWGNEGVIMLGEKGRGRHLTYVLVQKEDTKTGKRVSLTDDDYKYISKFKSCYITYSKNKSPIIVLSVNEPNTNDVVLVYSTYSCYTRGANGYLASKDDITVIATGTYAFGAAGRVGGGIDYLMIVPDNCIIRVRDSSMHKGDIYYLINHQGKIKRITLEDIQYMDIEVPTKEDRI